MICSAGGRGVPLGSVVVRKENDVHWKYNYQLGSGPTPKAVTQDDPHPRSSPANSQANTPSTGIVFELPRSMKELSSLVQTGQTNTTKNFPKSHAVEGKSPCIFLSNLRAPNDRATWRTQELG
ncbi:hypothetical protein TBK1r_04050 [Stieleria magnilauensis]|uniref:Uncharacterized protein n=1 Tax=Stieleria magnilauensis TaxID=2527963 RepID=A0ABX5XHL6_9BACT|nr:hypothetical protein TBK1r_04050 [Planctomycetes bacterium TBK1r]